MRRAVLALTIGVLLAVAGCGASDRPTAGDRAATGTVAVQPALAETKVLCEALGKVYSQNLGPFAEALSKMVADRNSAADAKTSQKNAQKALSAFATAVRDAAQTSASTEVRAAGKEAADRLQAKSADDKFFGGIKTSEDVEKVLGPTLKEWLAPFDNRCS